MAAMAEVLTKSKHECATSDPGTKPGKRVCLVTCAHLSYNPRLLKEADALLEAGYTVRVVSLCAQDERWKLDEALMSSRRWKLETVDVRRSVNRGRGRWFKAGLRQKFLQRVLPFTTTPGVMERAYSRYFPELAGLAGREPADLFIAHNLPALPAAAAAARRRKTLLGFDAEDFHRGEFPEAEQDSLMARLTRTMEEKYLTQCAHLTASSDGIGAAYARALRIRSPVTVLNTFPLAERKGQTPPAELASERRLPGLSLYWYSQVIGPDRGLDDALAAVALAGPGVSLHLRGHWAAGFESRFLERVRALGISDRVIILVSSRPHQLVERAQQHDVGLALEPGDRVNNRLATSNKLMVYFLAGLAVAATDVPGQRAVMEVAGESGLLFKPGEPGVLANQLCLWRDQPALLARAKSRAHTLGETRFCWDLEKLRLLRAVAETFNS